MPLRFCGPKPMEVRSLAQARLENTNNRRNQKPSGGVATFVREDNLTTGRLALPRFIGNPAVSSREKEGSALPWQRPYVSFTIDVDMPLYPSIEHFFDAMMFVKMKRGAYIINTASGKLVKHDAVVRALIQLTSPARLVMFGPRASAAGPFLANTAVRWYRSPARRFPRRGAMPLARCDSAELFRWNPSVRNKSSLTMGCSPARAPGPVSTPDPNVERDRRTTARCEQPANFAVDPATL
jgi:hypothetical protein